MQLLQIFEMKFRRRRAVGFIAPNSQKFARSNPTARCSSKFLEVSKLLHTTKVTRVSTSLRWDRVNSNLPIILLRITGRATKCDHLSFVNSGPPERSYHFRNSRKSFHQISNSNLTQKVARRVRTNFKRGRTSFLKILTNHDKSFSWIIIENSNCHPRNYQKHILITCSLKFSWNMPSTSRFAMDGWFRKFSRLNVAKMQIMYDPRPSNSATFSPKRLSDDEKDKFLHTAESEINWSRDFKKIFQKFNSRIEKRFSQNFIRVVNVNRSVVPNLRCTLTILE